MKLPTLDSSFDEIVQFLGLKDKNICDKFTERYCGKGYGKYYIEIDTTDMFSIYYFVVYNRFTHNEFGPARLIFNKKTTKLCHISYMIRGNYHRIGFPAVIEIGANGIIEYEAYHINSLLHNSIAPAARAFRNGCWNNYFYIKGKHYSRDNFFQRYMKV